jgi:hypothetical protein
MADNSVTLILDGTVSLEAFAQGVAGFTDLVAALSQKIAHEPLNWELSNLQFSSAVMSLKSRGPEQESIRVVNAYEEVADSLLGGTPTAKFGPKVMNASQKLVDLPVERLRLETANREILVPSTLSLDVPVANAVPSLALVRNRKPSLGAIQGRIQTLSNRGELRFTLYDTQNDKAVSCYFEDGKQEIIRDMWGKMATVEGTVTRDPVSGRPLSIRSVKTITPLPEPRRSSNYQKAMGVLDSNSELSPEEIIRRMRDA